MSERVVIVDYGVGNLRSVARAIEHCGAEPVLATDADTVRNCTRLLVPGVGAFGSCVAALTEHGLRDAVLEVMGDGRPVLGICVGMQMLFEVSEEFGEHLGLGILPGRVVAIPATRCDGMPHKIPNVGWRELHPDSQDWSGSIFDGVEPGSTCYFVHSFSGVPERSADSFAVSSYGGRRICAAVRRGNVYGLQFHPEKSGAVGLHMLRNFVALES